MDSEANYRGEIEEIIDEAEKRFTNLKNFDIISDPPSDHHYLNDKKSSSSSSKQVVLGSKLGEKIEHEWKVLETDLHNSIYVRAYETRVDLMRAAIVGLPRTPYSQGLFFFDILIPSRYPNRPPKLFYHSYDIELNPNLNQDGKVYLKLLKKWNPENSTVLQILVSLQSLVLNTKPFMNESESLRYNKHVFMLTCESMIRNLRTPPRHFEDLVAGHYRKSAHSILMNYRDRTDQSEYMTELFLKLLQAFEQNGTYCQHHLGQMDVQKDTREQRGENNGVGLKVFTKLKSIIGLQ